MWLIQLQTLVHLFIAMVKPGYRSWKTYRLKRMLGVSFSQGQNCFSFFFITDGVSLKKVLHIQKKISAGSRSLCFTLLLLHSLTNENHLKNILRRKCSSWNSIMALLWRWWLEVLVEKFVVQRLFKQLEYLKDTFCYLYSSLL